MTDCRTPAAIAEPTAPGDKNALRVVVCAGTACIASGALDVYAALKDRIKQAGLSAEAVLADDDQPSAPGKPVTISGCQGFCQIGPLVTIWPRGILYTKVTVDDVPEIVEKTLRNGNVVERLLYRESQTGQTCLTANDMQFYKKQTRIVMRDCGLLDPEDLQEYLDNGGYETARKAYTELTPEEICKTVIDSGLRGRGGGGFPTGRKWDLTRVQPGPKKYVICNGDEGDPGAFMDQGLMEGNPHCVIEGMMICARAIGADEAYIYVRTEYPTAVKRLRKAVKDATERGILGDSLFGTDAMLTFTVMEGAGAFVCGEETALMASIEGKRGMPRPKPPFPAESGLWGKPTVINNVETLATVPLILSKGAETFRAVGTEKSPGTKTFALTGHIMNAGLIEVPLGTTLREIVYDIGGGVTDDRGNLLEDGFKAVQIGGPSGGCLTVEHLDMPLDYDSLREVGAIIGSGGLVVMNKNTCMVKIARFFMEFTQCESCGKCVPCREGTKQLLALLDDIIAGRATDKTLDTLERLAHTVQVCSLCGLGKTAPNPVLSTLRHFKGEYLAHVRDKFCPTKRCRALLKPEIDPEACIGCGACARKCPVNAISGEPKSPYSIDPNLCTKCGICAETCKFDAVIGL